MIVRNLEDRDIPVLREWHRQSGFDYQFPDLQSAEFETVRVLVDDQDRPIQAVAAKKTVEIYYLLDSTWKNPRWRLEGLMRLHEDIRGNLELAGIGEAHCWLPPEVEKSFGRRLQRLFGWIPSRWRSYSRTVKD